MNTIELCKIKNKKKWTSKETYNTIVTFLDFVENDIHNVKPRKTKNSKRYLKGRKNNYGTTIRINWYGIITANAHKGGAVVVHELEQKKWVIGSNGWIKRNIDF